MSLQDRQRAARIIQEAWRGHMNREVFKYFKTLVSSFSQQDPKVVLRTVNPREGHLLDAAAGVFIRFRLGGITFPPNIYYKIFTHRPIADLCASSPEDYTQQSLKRSVAQQTNNGWSVIQEDRSGWYQRKENNGWRLFCKFVPLDEPAEIGANKKINFHYSRLQRRQDVGRWRKRRKIEWLKQMYNQGRQQTNTVHQHVAELVRNLAQEMIDFIEEDGDDEVLEWELDEMLAWTNTLSFEDYMEEWRCLACSLSSDHRKDVHLHYPWEIHKFADKDN